MALLWTILRSPSGAVSVGILFLLVTAGLVGPSWWGNDPLDVDLGRKLLPLTWAHPLGTDQYGRDLLARFMAGAQLTLLTGFLAATLGALIGGPIGLVAGFLGAWTDNVLMRLMDTVLSFPPLMMAMAIAMAMGGGLHSAVIGIGFATVPWYARIVRSRVLELRETEFVDAAEALGGARGYILRRHVLPQVLPLLLIQATLTFGYAVLTVAGLSFVGFGAQPPTPEWGVMISEGQKYALSGQWWVPFAPGLGLFAAVVAVNLLGDRLRDVLEPGAEM